MNLELLLRVYRQVVSCKNGIAYIYLNSILGLLFRVSRWLLGTIASLTYISTVWIFALAASCLVPSFTHHEEKSNISFCLCVILAMLVSLKLCLVCWQLPF